MHPAAHSGPIPPGADRTVGLFLAFRVLFHARFYYPVFMVMFLDFGITLEEFGILNAVWAAAIVLLEVPSGALADLVGRRRLLIAGAALMVVEMLLLCLVPVPSTWVMPVLVCNRIVSGVAEAFISGADEALAFDALLARGRATEWPRVLERLMRWTAAVTVVAMVTGSLVYAPGPLNALLRTCGFTAELTAEQTFRLPVWLTLGSALAALAVACALREPPRPGSASAPPAAVSLAAPFRQTAATGLWILGHPLVLLVIAGGVLFDQPIRQVLVVASEIHRRIGIPEPAFGVVSAASALLGLVAAAPMRRLALAHSPRFNVFLLAGMTLVGLVGTALLVPRWGVCFFMLLTLALRLAGFLQSHYLNQLVDSTRRATVLSFRGLAVNVSYGLTSLGFAAAVAAVDGAAGGRSADGPDAFRIVLAGLPVVFAIACVLGAWWARRLLPGGGPLGDRGGFAAHAPPR